MSPLEKVTLWNRFGEAAIYGPDYISDLEYEEDEDHEYSFGKELLDQFTAKHEFLGNRFHADPNEPYYQGINFMSVWKRKSDGKCFGYQYWESIHKHGEPYIESNGDSHGIDWQDPRGEAFVFVEVEPFTITGYKFDE